MTEPITTVAVLEGVVGRRPPTHHLKSIADLDPHCAAILAASPLSALATVAGDGSIGLALVGGDPGVLARADATHVDLQAAPVPDVPDGAPAALLTLVPGYGETLRVNGRWRSGAGEMEVEEAFLHCAKAVIRSELWRADGPAASTPVEDPSELPPAGSDGGALTDPEVAAFLAASPFVLLGTVDAGGAADVSPKGDPPGFVQVLDDRTVAVPDRPGNHRTDTLHNLFDRPEIAMLALVPGDDRALELRGTARITDAPGVLAAMEVHGKVPKAAVVVDVVHVDLRPEPALVAARLWDPAGHVAPGVLPKATKIWVDHVKRNQDPGLAAKAARKLLNEKLMGKAIDHDYGTNLY